MKFNQKQTIPSRVITVRIKDELVFMHARMLRTVPSLLRHATNNNYILPQ